MFGDELLMEEESGRKVKKRRGEKKGRRRGTGNSPAVARKSRAGETKDGGGKGKIFQKIPFKVNLELI